METHDFQNIQSKIADLLICKLTDKEPAFRLRAARGLRTIKTKYVTGALLRSAMTNSDRYSE